MVTIFHKGPGPSRASAPRKPVICAGCQRKALRQGLRYHCRWCRRWYLRDGSEAPVVRHNFPAPTERQRGRIVLRSEDAFTRPVRKPDQ